MWGENHKNVQETQNWVLEIVGTKMHEKSTKKIKKSKIKILWQEGVGNSWQKDAQEKHKNVNRKKLKILPKSKLCGKRGLDVRRGGGRWRKTPCWTATGPCWWSSMQIMTSIKEPRIPWCKVKRPKLCRYWKNCEGRWSHLDALLTIISPWLWWTAFILIPKYQNNAL